MRSPLKSGLTCISWSLIYLFWVPLALLIRVISVVNPKDSSIAEWSLFKVKLRYDKGLK